MAEKMKFTPVFDNGHGGRIGGQYQTPGKRSPQWFMGVLYEGCFNRWVVNRLMERMDRGGMPYYHVSPELVDTPLADRVKRANGITNQAGYPYLLSIHANAGGGEGYEVYTSLGQTKSDAIAEVFIQEIGEELPDHPLRSDPLDGDRDKEAKFYVLENTKCPAVLVEVAFMDNDTDYRKLWSEAFLEHIVNALFRAIKRLYEEGI